jgi:putative tricarboxylic transport membrane protein
MSVIPAITLMLATQAASYYAASITAILLNTPGAPESYPTTLDGFPMAKRGTGAGTGATL